MRYYIDTCGKLWKGPCCPEDNVNYGTYEGKCNTDNSEIWVVGYTDPPKNSLEIWEYQKNLYIEILDRVYGVHNES